MATTTTSNESLSARCGSRPFLNYGGLFVTVRGLRTARVPKATAELGLFRVALILMAAISLSTLAADPPPLNLIKTIPLPGVQGRFDHFSIDAKDNRLFVAALGNNSLEAVNLGAGKRLKSVAGMSKPTGVLYLPGNNLVAVANGDDGTLKLLDGSSFKVIHNLSELPDADNLRLDPNTGLAWLGYGDGALGIIDAAAPKLTARVKLSGHPESFQLEKQGSRVFINIPDANQIALVDAAKHEVIGNWPMEKFQSNFPMALDETNHRLFVGCRKPARLVVLNTGTGKAVADLAISGDTDDLFYDPKRKRLYLSSGEGFVDVIGQRDPDGYSQLARIPTSPGARTSFFSPELDRFYLALPTHGKQHAEIRIYEPQD